MGRKSNKKQLKNTQVLVKNAVGLSTLHWITLIGVSVVLFYPPFFRALYFTREQLPTQLFTYLLFILWWVDKYRRQDAVFLSNALDYCVFGFMLSYALSFTVAINIRGAIQEFLKVSNYFLIYWLVAQMAGNKKELRVILNVLVFSALGVAVLGLGAAAGTWTVQGGYANGRIYSTIQYPNSLAAYLTGALLISMGLMQIASDTWKRVYLGAAYLILLVAILTQSRGGWLVMPMFMVLYLLLLPGQKRREGILGLGLVSLTAVAFTPFITKAHLGGNGWVAWQLVLTGLVLVVLLHFVLARVRLNTRVAWAVTGVVVVLMIFVGVFFVKGDLNRFLPEVMASRRGFTLSEQNVQERFLFYSDALKIIRDYPVLGMGGQGWNSRYLQYQSAGYMTKEVHNHFLQVWVETGIIGFLFFVGIWFSLIYSVFRFLRSEEDDNGKALVVAAACGTLAVVLHSLMDVNLSLGSVGIFTFALAGAVRSMLPHKESKWHPYKGVAAFVVGGVLFVGVFSLYLGYISFARGVAQYSRGDLQGAISSLEQAVMFDRFDPEIRLALADSYELQGTQDRTFVKAEDEYLKAVALDRYQPDYSNMAGAFYVRTGNYDEGLRWLENSGKLQPKNFRQYVNHGRVLLHIAERFYEDGQRDTGEMYLEQVEPLAAMMAEKTGNTEALDYAIGQAYYMRGNYERALPYLEQALQVKEGRARAAMLLSLVFEARGEKAKAREYADQALEWDPGIEEFAEMIKRI